MDLESLPVRAFRELVAARDQLRKVRPAIGPWTESELRAPNAEAIRAARENVSRARAMLTEEAARDARWAAIATRLASLPAGLVVEPFGPLSLRGARAIEHSGATRDRTALRAIMKSMHELAEQIGDPSLINALAALEPKPPSGRIRAWLWRTFGDG